MKIQTSLAEGGTVTFQDAVVPHLHVESDDDTYIFGLAVAIRRREDNEFYHAIEHMIMRGDNGDFPYSLESASTARWWQAITTRRDISFEAASYTPECFKKTAENLCANVFSLQIEPSQFSEEFDHSVGRVGVEHSMQQGPREMLLRVAASALFDENLEGDEHQPTVDQLSLWYDANIEPGSMLWFTYGRMDHRGSMKMVQSLVEKCGK